MFQRNKPQTPQTRFNSRNNPRSHANANELEAEGATHPLFPLAVFIMGIVSCYTTALGLEPMLDNLILSYAMAFALSIFMVAIALQFPKSYQNGTQNRLILGYSMVAIFSVLLNFNAIYGIFTAEKLLYDELKANRQKLTALQVSAEEALDEHFDAQETRQQLQEAMALLEEEKTNPNDYGYGTKARTINKESVIPLQAKMDIIQTKYEPLVTEIDTTVSNALSTIDEALASENVGLYRKAVDASIDAYTTVGTKTANLIGDSTFAYEPLEFQHRDVGHLNHSLWSLAHLGKMEGKEVSALLVSLLLAILIDFIVLFVLVLLHKPGKVEEEAAEEAETAAAAAKGKPARQSFAHKPATGPQAPVEQKQIYAKRSRRTKPQGETDTKQAPASTPQAHRPGFQATNDSDWVVSEGKLNMNGKHIDLS